MEIILKQDIHKLGYANDIVKVKKGYARNYLIPKGYAILATETNRKILAENIKQKTFREEKIRKEAETLAKALSNTMVKIGAKVAKNGKIFGSVNNIQVADAIKKQFNYTIDRKKIQIDSESIKEIGIYTAKVHLYKDITVNISFEVVAE